MVHHGFGGLGAWLGARVYDAGGAYWPAFLTMFVATLAAMGLTLAYKAAPASPRNRS